jgi:hypothetical protein
VGYRLEFIEAVEEASTLRDPAREFAVALRSLPPVPVGKCQIPARVLDRESA